MTAYEALTRKYTLEASIRELEDRCEEQRSRIPELKCRKREADAACLASGGRVQRFLDRLLGKEEGDSEISAQAARDAAAALGTAQRELDFMEEKLSRLRKEYDDLGEKEVLASELSAGEKEHFLRLEASLCAEAALHFLRKAGKELSAAQELARNPMMAPGDGRRENTHQANAGALADRCRENLQRILDCGFSFEIHPYIQNPMGYLVTARQYGELDRLNSAMNGIQKTEASLKKLLLQLAE